MERVLDCLVWIREEGRNASERAADRAQGMAVLFTEHSMDVVFAYADRMIVLARGRLIAEGKPLELRDHPKVQEVYFGTGKTFEKKAAANAEAA